MVLKRKRVGGGYLIHKPYLNHPSHGVADDTLKSIMCRDIRERVTINREIDKVEKSIKLANASLYKAKSSVMGLRREFGNSFEHNYRNFIRSSYNNPFSKYGVLLDDHKSRSRRKTSSAPPFMGFGDSMGLTHSLSPGLEASRNRRDTALSGDEDAEKYVFSVEDGDTHAPTSSQPNYLNRTINLTADFSLNAELNENSYRRSLAYESARTYRTDYDDLPRAYRGDYADTSRPYKFDAIEPIVIEIDPVEPKKKVAFAPVDVIFSRLYECTKLPTFEPKNRRTPFGERDPEAELSPVERKATMFLKSPRVTQVLDKLIPKLEAIVEKSLENPIRDRLKKKAPRPRATRPIPQRTASQNPITQRPLAHRPSPLRPLTHRQNTLLPSPVRVSPQTARLPVHETNPFRGNFTREAALKDTGRLATGRFARVNGTAGYDATNLEITPNKYARRDEFEDPLLRVSTDSAVRAMRRVGKRKRPESYDANDDFMLTDSEDYAAIDTKFGRITYSPKMQDDKYMYRFVVLTPEAQKAVEMICKRSPHKRFKAGTTEDGNRLLTECEIIKDLGIRMSSGWEHFFYFKNSNKELILRKPL